mgnify:FL=1
MYDNRVVKTIGYQIISLAIATILSMAITLIWGMRSLEQTTDNTAETLANSLVNSSGNDIELVKTVTAGTSIVEYASQSSLPLLSILKFLGIGLLVILGIRLSLNLLYKTIPISRPIIDKFVSSKIKDEIGLDLKQYAKRLGIRTELLPKLYKAEFIKGVDKYNKHSPFTLKANITPYCEELRQTAILYNEQLKFESLKEREGFIKWLRQLLVKEYNDAMIKKLDKLSDDGIEILKKILCNNEYTKENDIVQFNVKPEYDMYSNTVKCSIKIHPKLELSRQRLEDILRREVNSDGDIIINREFNDIVKAVDYIKGLEGTILDTNEEQRVKEILEHNIKSDLNPINIEDDVTIYSIKHNETPNNVISDVNNSKGLRNRSYY